MNDLGLDLDFGRTSGRRSKEVGVEVLRELEPSDAEQAQAERGSTAPNLKKLRDRHHALAKALATGTPEGDAAIMCGYSPSRVSILKDDPAFVELVAFYRKGQEEQYYGIHEKLAGVAGDALDELSERLEEKPEDFTPGQLMDLAKLGADRTGHGPSSSTQVDVRVGLADRLDSARKRLASRKDIGLDIEGSAKDITPAEGSPTHE